MIYWWFSSKSIKLKSKFSEALGLGKRLASWLTEAGINVARVETLLRVQPKRSSLDRYQTVGI